MNDLTELLFDCERKLEDQDLDEAIKFFNKAYDEATDWKGQYSALFMLGYCYFKLNRTVLALNYFKMAEDLANENFDRKKRLQALGLITLCYQKNKDKASEKRTRAEMERIKAVS